MQNKHQVTLTDKQWFNLIAGMQAGLYCKNKNAPYSSVTVINKPKLPDNTVYLVIEMVGGGSNATRDIVPLIPGSFEPYTETLLGYGTFTDTRYNIQGHDYFDYKISVLASENIKELTVQYSPSVMMTDTEKMELVRACDITAPDIFDIRKNSFVNKPDIINIGFTITIKDSNDVGLSEFELCRIRIGRCYPTYAGTLVEFRNTVNLKVPNVSTVCSNTEHKLKYMGIYSYTSPDHNNYNGCWGWIVDVEDGDPKQTVYNTSIISNTKTSIASTKATEELVNGVYDDKTWIVGSKEYNEALSRYGYANISGNIYSDIYRVVSITYKAANSSFEYNPIKIELMPGNNNINVKLPLFNNENSFAGDGVLVIREKTDFGSQAIDFDGTLMIEISTTSSAPKIPFEPLSKDKLEFEDTVDVEFNIPVDSDVDINEELTFEDNIDLDVNIPFNDDIDFNEELTFEDNIDLDVNIPFSSDTNVNEELTFSDKVKIN